MLPLFFAVAAQAEKAQGRPLSDAERAALQRLYVAHQEVVWRVLRRSGLSDAQADDGCQQVFMVALKRLSELTAVNERSFLCGAAILVARKQKQRHWREVVPERLPDGDTGARPDDHAEHRRRLQLLDAALARMEEPLRAVFVLQEIEGFSKREAAIALGLPEGTVATRLRRARAAFDDALAAVLPRGGA